MLVNGKLGKDMAVESIIINMEMFMMGNGKMDLKVDMAS